MVGSIIALIGVLIVFIWFIETSPIGGQGEWTFNQWSLNDVVWFIILLILLELLFVGVPVAIFAGVGFYIWWMRLSEEEKKEFKEREKKGKKNKHGGSGCGCVMFIALCIYIAINGNFNTKFAYLPYSYFIYSMLYTVMWIIIILGIPAAIILLIVYLTVWRKKSI